MEWDVTTRFREKFPGGMLMRSTIYVDARKPGGGYVMVPARDIKTILTRAGWRVEKESRGNPSAVEVFVVGPAPL